MTLGPLEYTVIGFAGNRFNGEIAKEIQKVVDKGIIRIVDLVFITKDIDGKAAVVELDAKDDPRFAGFAPLLDGLHRPADPRGRRRRSATSLPTTRRVSPCSSSTAGPRTSRTPSSAPVASSSPARPSRPRSSKSSTPSSRPRSRPGTGTHRKERPHDATTRGVELVGVAACRGPPLRHEERQASRLPPTSRPPTAADRGRRPQIAALQAQQQRRGAGPAARRASR